MSEGDLGPDLGEVIVEFTRNGAYLKCSAIHVATGREVSAMGQAASRRRAMIMRWISLVPSMIWFTFASRIMRSTGNSVE